MSNEQTSKENEDKVIKEQETANKNQKQEQGTCASSCGVNQAYIEKGDASGTGATQVNANHIIQYPKQPKYTDGKWISLGSLIGALLGKFAEKGSIDKAKEAESNWARINQQLHDKGNELWNLAPAERSRADDADADLENEYNWNKAQRDAELARAEKLDACADELNAKMCQFATCGYTPDYDGIGARIRADIAASLKKSRTELTHNLNRYSARQCCGIEKALATTAVATTVSAMTKAYEDERARAWQINEKMLYQTAAQIEQHRNGRITSAAAFDKTGIGIQQTRYVNHNNNYIDWTKAGGDFLSSAGRNYAWLSESHRKTAEKASSSLSNLGALIAMALGMWLSNGKEENEC